MRTAAFRYSIGSLGNPTRQRWKSFNSPTNCLSFSRHRELPVNAAPYTLRSTSVNSSATFTVIYCPIQRHSVVHKFMNLRTFNLFSIQHFASRSTVLVRNFASRAKSSSNATNTVRYIVATTIAVLGLSYAAVPLYRLFCQASGYGGTVTRTEAGDKVEQMEPDRQRSIIVRFNADTSAAMRWHFKPQQKEISVVPGETALAFYTARNPTDRPVTGISTYNVVPFEAGQYFNKIQCFCFEEQILNPNEQVDMPVFFYIDPEFSEDPAMARVTTLTLSYTFFEAKEGDSIYSLSSLPPPQHKRQ